MCAYVYVRACVYVVCAYVYAYISTLTHVVTDMQAKCVEYTHLPSKSTTLSAPSIQCRSVNHERKAEEYGRERELLLKQLAEVGITPVGF